MSQDQEQVDNATIFKCRIRKSAVMFKINRIASDVFAQWLKNAKFVHGIEPQLLDRIKDDEVRDVFIDHLASAIKSFIEEKSDKMTATKGWSYGYICGYIQGRIDVSWYNKYVLELSSEYENLLKLKSIIEYLKYDGNVMDRIHHIYDHLLSQRIQPTDNMYSSDKIVSILSHKNSKLIKKNEFKKSLIELLSSHIEKQMLLLLDANSHDCCPDISVYVTYDDMIEILEVTTLESRLL
jgi:hypothetical protein